MVNTDFINTEYQEDQALNKGRIHHYIQVQKLNYLNPETYVSQEQLVKISKELEKLESIQRVIQELPVDCNLTNLLMAILSYEISHPKIKDFKELALIGISITKVESLWGNIFSFMSKYIESIGYSTKLQIFSELVNACLESRKVIVERVLEKIEHTFNISDSKLKVKIITNFYKNKQYYYYSEEAMEKEIQELYDFFVESIEQNLINALEASTTDKIITYAQLKNMQSVLGDKVNGVVTPKIDTLIKINQVIFGGGEIRMYCCPDYKRIFNPETCEYEYTFTELNEGPGLTAQIGLPVLINLIAKIRNKVNNNELVIPVLLNIGVADFEATTDNVQQMNLKTIEEFERKLGLSIRSIANLIVELADQNGLNVKIIEDTYLENDQTIGRVTMHVYYKEHLISYVNLQRVTVLSNKEKEENRSSREVFQERVSKRRSELIGIVEEKDLNSDNFKRRLDLLIKLRLSLWSKWTDEKDPTVPKVSLILKNLFLYLDNIHYNQEISDPYNISVFLNPILIADINSKTKQEIIRKIVFNWLSFSHLLPEGIMDNIGFLNTYEKLIEYLKSSKHESIYTLVKPILDTKLDENIKLQLIIQIIKGIYEINLTQDPHKITINEKEEALNFLRKKAASQGAEYSLMHGDMQDNVNFMQLIADAANMWEVFGNKKITQLYVNGGYIGSGSIENAQL